MTVMEGRYNRYFALIASMPASITASGSLPIALYVSGDNSADDADNIVFRSFPNLGNFAAILIALLYWLVSISCLSSSSFVIPLCFGSNYIGSCKL